jgi:nucleotide-binding universal stress UspA family protein
VNRTEQMTSVVVGIDGSSSAVHAAEWAVAEAVSRDVTLRLIHVIQSTSPDIHLEIGDAEAALRAAHTAVSQTGQPVKIETAVVRGPVAATLVAESVDAAMISVGSTGIGHRASKFVGATASAVADSARCQVAIIRTPDDAARSGAEDVAVVVDDPSDLDVILQVALAEARSG